jgi:hypothetical protein
MDTGSQVWVVLNMFILLYKGTAFQYLLTAVNNYWSCIVFHYLIENSCSLLEGNFNCSFNAWKDNKLPNQKLRNGKWKE